MLRSSGHKIDENLATQSSKQRSQCLNNFSALVFAQQSSDCVRSSPTVSIQATSMRLLTIFGSFVCMTTLPNLTIAQPSDDCFLTDSQEDELLVASACSNQVQVNFGNPFFCFDPTLDNGSNDFADFEDILSTTEDTF